ncbi:hypothetical protein JYT83_01380 [bacterium AH-315-F18]|nr:hypothetical protein [bacterium AH-315-F18]
MATLVGVGLILLGLGLSYFRHESRSAAEGHIRDAALLALPHMAEYNVPRDFELGLLRHYKISYREYCDDNAEKVDGKLNDFDRKELTETVRKHLLSGLTASTLDPEGEIELAREMLNERLNQFVPTGTDMFQALVSIYHKGLGCLTVVEAEYVAYQTAFHSSIIYSEDRTPTGTRPGVLVPALRWLLNPLERELPQFEGEPSDTIVTVPFDDSIKWALSSLEYEYRKLKAASSKKDK